MDLHYIFLLPFCMSKIFYYKRKKKKEEKGKELLGTLFSPSWGMKYKDHQTLLINQGPWALVKMGERLANIKNVPNTIWYILTLRNYSLFTWNSNLMRYHSFFYLLNLLTLFKWLNLNVMNLTNKDIFKSRISVSCWEDNKLHNKWILLRIVSGCNFGFYLFPFYTIEHKW